MDRPDESPTRGINYGVMGFIAMSYVIVGLIGGFATFAVKLPHDRGAAREVALDAALATNADAAALAGLAKRLGDSAPALKGATAADLPARVAAERTAMRARFRAEADDLAFRLRIVIGMITLSAAGFGLAMAGTVRKRPHK